MTPDHGSGGPRIFTIDGRKVESPSDFYREIGRAVNGPGGYFGRNLDALADCLRGGFGTPENEPYEFDWRHSRHSRHHLGDGQETFLEAVRAVFDDAGVTLILS